MDLANWGLSFIEGIGIILSPCILPILPLLLATGLQGDKRRPYGVTTGFIITFISFTLLSRQLLSAIHIDQQLIQEFSSYFLLIFGVILFSEYLSGKFNVLTSNLASVGQDLSFKFNKISSQGFSSGILLGCCIALIWIPCAGPILAAILVQTLQQHTNSAVIISLLFFSLGVTIPMLLMTIFGRAFINRAHGLKTHAVLIRKILAVLIIGSVMLNKFDFWSRIFSTDITSDTPINTKSKDNFSHALINGIATPYPAPSIQGGNKWLNSSELDLKALKGKVVLIDFWTYSCINCLRTLPHLKAWNKKYRDQGLVIIGVHSPEFEFEKNSDNIAKALKDFDIQYPVVMDNNLTIWSNYSNSYWPAHYLINKEGQVVYTHFGEGMYDTTENNIRFLLGIEGVQDKANVSEQDNVLTATNQTPETYLGNERSNSLQSPEKVIVNENTTYSYPEMLPLHTWALKDDWRIEKERIVSQKKGASLKLHFNAQKVFLVLRPSDNKPVSAKIMLNNQPIGVAAGKDVKENQVTVLDNKLYELVDLNKKSDQTLEIIADDKGLEAYAFTFG